MTETIGPRPRDWLDRVAAKAAEFGEPLAAARRLYEMDGGPVSYLAGVALERSLSTAGWAHVFMNGHSPNYDRMSGPLRSGSGGRSVYIKDSEDVGIDVSTWKNDRTGGSGATLALVVGAELEALRAELARREAFGARGRALTGAGSDPAGLAAGTGDQS